MKSTIMIFSFTPKVRTLCVCRCRTPCTRPVSVLSFTLLCHSPDHHCRHTTPLIKDDIRVSPTTVTTYWQETQGLKNWPDTTIDYTLFNFGIVRYEYNFPSVIIDDKTRHATENVTRVYWEHSHVLAEKDKPIVPGAARGVDTLNALPGIRDHYIRMHNSHQGMFLATREHLIKWKELANCRFDVATNRPGTPQQPLIGTQRVWMSSYQLYEPRYCNIQQVIPVSKYGALTVHHIPNKNYRRKQGGTTQLKHHSEGIMNTTEINQGSPKLVKALHLHLDMRRKWPVEPEPGIYHGIQVRDEVTQERNSILDERFFSFRAYVQRGGVLSEEDMQDTELRMNE
jgi:hypothetical protein